MSILRDCIEKLPSEFREVIVMRELEDMSYRQISEVACLPVGHRHVPALSCAETPGGVCRRVEDGERTNEGTAQRELLEGYLDEELGPRAEE